MKRLLMLIAFSASVGFSVIGCSTQHREGNTNVDVEEMFMIMDDINMNVTNTQVSSFAVDSIRSDPTAKFYFTKSSESAPAGSVVSMNDLNVIFPEFEPGTMSPAVGFDEIAAFFVDAHDENGNRMFALMVRGIYGGMPLYYMGVSEPNNYAMSDTTFETVISSGNGPTLILRSRDLHPDFTDELSSGVKLEIWINDGGQDYYAGQISTMAAFGG